MIRKLSVVALLAIATMAVDANAQLLRRNRCCPDTCATSACTTDCCPTVRTPIRTRFATRRACTSCDSCGTSVACAPVQSYSAPATYSAPVETYAAAPMYSAPVETYAAAPVSYEAAPVEMGYSDMGYATDATYATAPISYESAPMVGDCGCGGTVAPVSYETTGCVGCEGTYTEGAYMEGTVVEGCVGEGCAGTTSGDTIYESGETMMEDATPVEAPATEGAPSEEAEGDKEA